MKMSKWFLTASLAAIIAFTSVYTVASAQNADNQGLKMGQGKGQMAQHAEEMKAALDSGDYDAFTAVAPEKLLEVINADNFPRFLEMHNHLEQARAIGDELGLPQGRIKGKFKANMNQNNEGFDFKSKFKNAQ